MWQCKYDVTDVVDSHMVANLSSWKCFLSICAVSISPWRSWRTMQCVVCETERQPQCFFNAVMPIQGLLLNVGMLDQIFKLTVNRCCFQPLWKAAHQCVNWVCSNELLYALSLEAQQFDSLPTLDVVS